MQRVAPWLCSRVFDPKTLLTTQCNVIYTVFQLSAFAVANDTYAFVNSNVELQLRVMKHSRLLRAFVFFHPNTERAQRVDAILKTHKRKYGVGKWIQSRKSKNEGNFLKGKVQSPDSCCLNFSLNNNMV